MGVVTLAREIRLSSHSKEVKNPGQTEGFAVWSMHDLPLSVWVCSMVWWIRDCKSESELPGYIPYLCPMCIGIK